MLSYTVVKLLHSSASVFGRKVQFFGEHGHDLWDLLLLVHKLLAGVRLVLVGGDVIGPREDPHDLLAVAVLLQDTRQRLHEPRAFARVAPREVACQHNEQHVIVIALISVMLARMSSRVQQTLTCCDNMHGVKSTTRVYLPHTTINQTHKQINSNFPPKSQ